MNFLSRFIRHQVMDNPDQPPEGVTDVPPSPSNDEEPPSPGLQRSGHHHALSTCAVHVLASPARHIRPGNAGGGAASTGNLYLHAHFEPIFARSLRSERANMYGIEHEYEDESAESEPDAR